MATEIKVPTLGESVTTATVARWLKQPGEAVAADEAVVELETDKVSVEVASPENGVLGAHAVAEGADVEVGAVLATVDPSGTPAAAPEPEAQDPGQGDASGALNAPTPGKTGSYLPQPELAEAPAAEVLALIDKLEQDDDVQKVFHTLA